MQFLPQEEGRLRPQRDASGTTTGFAYDYAIKDHLGNVRMMLTEDQRIDPYPQLTFEGAAATTEVTNQDAYWENKNTQSIDVTTVRTARPGRMGIQAANGDYAMLTQKSTGSIGATKFLKVMASDRLHASVDYYYNTTSADNSTASPLSAIVNSLTSAIAGSAAASGLIHSGSSTIASQLSGNGAFGSAVSAAATTDPNNSSQQAPKAYLCILFFNEQFAFDNVNSVVVPVGYTPGTMGTIDKRFSNAISVPRNGYAYVYFTNESDELVYWDNFTLSHERSPILEETHYYPFGTRLEGICSRAAMSQENKYQYAGKELQSKEFSDGKGLQWLDFGARMYDAQIGRWFSIDPLADQMRRHSPYNFAFDNPMRFIDPDGMGPEDVILSGPAKQKAYAELQKSVNGQLNLSMNANGKVSYTAVKGATLNANAKQLKTAIDDHSVKVNITATDGAKTSQGKLFIGGAFMGNTVTNGTAEAKQEINPTVLSKLDNYFNKPGGSTLHEVTEAYQGAKLAQKEGAVGSATSADVGNPNSIYSRAHNQLATPQSGGSNSVGFTWYDSNGNVIPSSRGWGKFVASVQEGKREAAPILTVTKSEFEKQ